MVCIFSEVSVKVQVLWWSATKINRHLQNKTSYFWTHYLARINFQEKSMNGVKSSDDKAILAYRIYTIKAEWWSKINTLLCLEVVLLGEIPV